MKKFTVALVRYEKPLDSVRRTVELCNGLENLSSSDRVFIKPNVLFWTSSVQFPKWGVITTSRVIEDMVILLNERGVSDITIGEGMVVLDPKDKETAHHAFESLGYTTLGRRYGVRCVSAFERPVEKVDLGDGVKLNFNTDFVHSDFVINIPVLKTHAQTVVSLGIKNLKGMLDVKSRKKCHNANPDRGLPFMVSKLADKLPRSFTIIDGIYSAERGPAFDGKLRRTDTLIGSQDVLSADMVGAKILGYEPAQVPYVLYAAKRRHRAVDLSDIRVSGERIEDLASPHAYTFPYTEDSTLPIAMEKMGIKGISYPRYDETMCTYCSIVNGLVITSIAFAWKGVPWDNVEVLTGKVMKPTPGKKTILLGKCLCDANKDHPDINKMICIKTCPPSPKAIVSALHQVGIDVNPAILENVDKAPAFYMRKYEGRPEFDESFFRIQE